jgi:hypothetical protein
MGAEFSVAGNPKYNFTESIQSWITIDATAKYCENSHTIETQLRTEETQRPEPLSFRALCAFLWPLINRMELSIFNRRSNRLPVGLRLGLFFFRTYHFY